MQSVIEGGRLEGMYTRIMSKHYIIQLWPLATQLAAMKINTQHSPYWRHVGSLLSPRVALRVCESSETSRVSLNCGRRSYLTHEFPRMISHYSKFC